jgi:hypothetical protein
VLVLSRFRTDPADDAGSLRSDLEAALGVLSAQRGFEGGRIGRNVDDPGLWVLETTWAGPGSYRRALSAYDVKVHVWPTLGRAIEEPTAYELLQPGADTNESVPRGTR